MIEDGREKGSRGGVTFHRRRVCLGKTLIFRDTRAGRSGPARRELWSGNEYPVSNEGKRSAAPGPLPYSPLPPPSIPLRLIEIRACANLRDEKHEFAQLPPSNVDRCLRGVGSLRRRRGILGETGVALRRAIFISR